MSGKMLPFPFEFFIENTSQKKLFLDTVEKVLTENLQSENSFGCKIHKCHTHVGSERHLADFIEAELLFHNSYYNKGFAVITAEKALEWLRLNTREEEECKVLLVGYENFSELYLCETVDVLNGARKGNVKAKYCIYENIGKTAEIRKLEGLLKEGFFDSDTKVIFVIPISTTFTTFQKLTTAFQNYLEQLGVTMPSERNILNIALIVIGQEDGVYWTRIKKNQGILELTQELYPSLPQREVHYFSFIQNQWYPLEKCPLCFPDIAGKEYVDEEPLFGINRASVVPMLQLENWKNPKPFSPEEIKKNREDFGKIVRLSNYMYQKHLQRNGNHFQYYFDTETFFDTERSFVETWLKNDVCNQLQPEQCGIKEGIVYDFLVAPRHYSNAGFVHAVNNLVFHGTARIFYFDVQREFRGNINAKYSDFQRYVSNIKSSKQKSIIRFHFVDDTIYSSGNFKRAQSLISTLAGNSDDDSECKIELYASCILLLGRNSKETKQFLLGSSEKFFEYVRLAISPMRNHEDACTLCMLEKNFKKIKAAATTNKINGACINTIASHQLEQVQDVKIPFEKPKLELRLRLIILHMITMRLSNKYMLPLKTEEPISREDEGQIFVVLKRMWRKLPDELDKLIDVEVDKNEFVQAVRCAFIKVITRPFYSFHIRQKQAAFRFCLDMLEYYLNKKTLTEAETKILKTLMNGLADMDANYLIRQENMIKILDKVDEFSYLKAVKKLTTLSQGDTKIMLLEALLTTGNEKTFFERKKQEWTLDIEVKSWLSLYLENNQILINGFKKWRAFIQTVGENGYGLSNFRQCLDWNGISETEQQNNLYRQYQDVVAELPDKEKQNKYELNFEQLEASINRLLDTKKSFLFVEDSEHISVLHNEMDRYILLNDSENGKNTLYKSSMQEKLDKIINGTENKLEIGDTLILPFHEEFCLIKIIAYDEEAKVKNESEGITDTVKKIMTLYLYVPVKHTFVIKDSQRTQECHNDLVQWLPLLMRMKILLTMRNEFEQLMKGYLGNIIKLIRNEQMEKALSISKATGHGASVMSQCPELEYIIDVVSKPINELRGEKKQIKKLFDRHIQLISNNFISELYRSIHTNEIKGNVEDEVWKCDHDVFGKPEYMIFLHSSLKNGAPEPIYEFMAPRKSIEEAKIQIKLHMKTGETWVMRYINRARSIGSTNFKIIILLACNVAYHCVQEDVLVMDVYREGRYLCMKNLWDLFEYDDILLSSATELCKEINEQMEIHPSKRREDAGISLWSLKKYCDELNPEEKENFIIDTDEVDGKKYFIVKMKVFKNDKDVIDS